MRSLLVVLSFILVSSYTFAQKAVELTFDNEMIELGKIKKGDKKTFQYHFTNTGKDDIEIDIVSGCDCTTLDWTREVIKPGKKGTIDVVFDSTKKEDTDPVTIDMILKNIDPRVEAGYLYQLEYTFDFMK